MMVVVVEVLIVRSEVASLKRRGAAGLDWIGLDWIGYQPPVNIGA